MQERGEALAQRTGLNQDAAKAMVELQCGGIQLPSIELPFDDPEMAGKNEGDVLEDSAWYVGETMADPVEGVNYGRDKAIIMQRADGTLWIHSFAHGKTIYELRWDAASIRKLVEAAADADAVALFVRLAVENRLDEQACDSMRDYLARRCRAKLGTIARSLKRAKRRRPPGCAGRRSGKGSMPRAPTRGRGWRRRRPMRPGCRWWRS